MNKQIASTIVMVPPTGFRYNNETAENNVFQDKNFSDDDKSKAMQEYQNMVETLRSHKIQVLELEQAAHLPDAVFPNNWFSTHLDAAGQTQVVLYPMQASNRQAEVNPQQLKQVLASANISMADMIDLRNKDNQFLEGTGSLIIDDKNKIVFASLSDRTNKQLVEEFADRFDYESVVFDAVDERDQAIYHTNVVMALADEIAVICLECIKDPKQRFTVEQKLARCGKEIISISMDQLKNMCANVLQLQNGHGDKFLVMSKTAFRAFNATQINLIKQSMDIIAVDIPTIERVGGGSARCMMAEVFHS